VPLLVFPKGRAEAKNLGTGETFSNIACSVAEFFGIRHVFPGKSFV
jgi:phosphopentomutase